MVKKYVLCGFLCLGCVLGLKSQNPIELVIKTQKPGAPIQPTMYGLFFEDINYGADGGLYAEMIKNRSFDFPQAFMGWRIFGNVSLQQGSPFENNPNYVRLENSGHSHKHTGIENEGFFDIAVQKDAEYRFSVWARTTGTEKEKIRIELVNKNNNPFVKQELEINSSEWKKYEITLKSNITDAKSVIRIFLASKGRVDLEHISLFPVATWKGRENGLRKDLVQALADIKPGVFRFPGGCIVEGTDLETRYDWKKSVGVVENRPLNENRWHYTFTHRFFPDYFQIYGLGFYEYFLLSEDIGAEPLPVVSCGLACQYQNNDPAAHVAVCDLESYIQDALDLIEFANGDVNTEWGKVRADMGHTEPFNLKFIGIGNEQWGAEYPERLELFVKAIRQAYPDIKIIGSSGPQSEGKDFDYLWPEMKRLKVDLVDEHFYRNEEWFLSQAARYDNYDRKGPKVFAGEYACHPKNRKNNFQAALAEAAFMTGLERNADVVHMATYAPLFAHVEGWQWRPDLIWFDNLNSVRSVNYYVQQLYAHNAGTNVLPLTWDKKPVTGQDGLYASAVLDKNENSIIVKIVNNSDAAKNIVLNFEGIKKKENFKSAEVILLHSENMDIENTLKNPEAVIPVNQTLSIENLPFGIEIGAKTFGVYKFKR